MNVYLIGFMGCGKNRIGKKLASRLKLEFSDTDFLVQEMSGMEIREIFARYGEGFFREKERDALRSIPNDDRLVITGGGLPCFESNMDYMEQNGYTVYIEVPVPILWARLNNAKNREKRPLIGRLDGAELRKYIETALYEREAFYKRADYIFKSQEEDMETLIRKVKDALGKERPA